MTTRQAQIWSLYASGHGPSAIAQALGLNSRGGVSSTIKKIKAEMQGLTKERVQQSTECPYSSSCFTCPLHDCGIDSTRAGRFNAMPYDMEVHR